MLQKIKEKNPNDSYLIYNKKSREKNKTSKIMFKDQINFILFF